MYCKLVSCADFESHSDAVRSYLNPLLFVLKYGVGASNNFTKRRQNGIKIGTRDKFAIN